jgi:hypothetical protein
MLTDDHGGGTQSLRAAREDARVKKKREPLRPEEEERGPRSRGKINADIEKRLTAT